MFIRNDGQGVNAIQNRFTAMLKTALFNRKIDYLRGDVKKRSRELPLEEYAYSLFDVDDFIETIMDYDVIRSALKTLNDRERKIIVLHIIEDMDFAEVGHRVGLSYKGTATAFYRAIKKLREYLGRYRDEL